jgi:hypothetical protein
MKSRSLLSLVCASIVILFSCKKDSDTTPPSETPEQLLTKSEWKMDEVRYSQVNTANQGTAYYYKKGVTTNVGNLDTYRLVFAANNTGTITLGSTIAPLTWQFTNPEKTKLLWIITYSPTNQQTVNWENIAITSTNIKYAEYFTSNTGITHLGSGTQVH